MLTAAIVLSVAGCSELANNVLSAPVQTVYTDSETPASDEKVKLAKLGEPCPRVRAKAVTEQGMRLVCHARDGFRPRWKKFL